MAGRRSGLGWEGMESQWEEEEEEEEMGWTQSGRSPTVSPPIVGSPTISQSSRGRANPRNAFSIVTQRFKSRASHVELYCEFAWKFEIGGNLISETAQNKLPG